jgi:hypothetical protein
MFYHFWFQALPKYRTVYPSGPISQLTASPPTASPPPIQTHPPVGNASNMPLNTSFSGLQALKDLKHLFQNTNWNRRTSSSKVNPIRAIEGNDMRCERFKFKINTDQDVDNLKAEIQRRAKRRLLPSYDISTFRRENLQVASEPDVLADSEKPLSPRDKIRSHWLKDPTSNFVHKIVSTHKSMF